MFESISSFAPVLVFSTRFQYSFAPVLVFSTLFLFCFELMFCASPVLLNLTVIKCGLGLIE